MRPMAGVAALAAAVLLASPAGAAMDVATFLAKAEALRAKNMVMVLFSSDLRLLRREAQAAATEYQADKAARVKANLPPLSCPPKDAKLGAIEFVDELKKLPVAERGMSLKDGMAWVSRRRFPCGDRPAN